MWGDGFESQPHLLVMRPCAAPEPSLSLSSGVRKVGFVTRIRVGKQLLQGLERANAKEAFVEISLLLVHQARMNEEPAGCPSLWHVWWGFETNTIHVLFL